MSAVETAWETMLGDQEEKYLEKHELIKNRQREYLEREIKSLLLEFTRNRCSLGPTALHIWNSSKVYCHLHRKSYIPWTSLWLCVYCTEPETPLLLQEGNHTFKSLILWLETPFWIKPRKQEESASEYLNSLWCTAKVHSPLHISSTFSPSLLSPAFFT